MIENNQDGNQQQPDCAEVLGHFNLVGRKFLGRLKDADKNLFCELAHAVNAAGLDWWYLDEYQLRFGRKNKGALRAFPMLGKVSVDGERTLIIQTNILVSGKTTVYTQTWVNLADVIENIKKALAEMKSINKKWPNLKTTGNRGGYWPDDFNSNSTESNEGSDGQDSATNDLPPQAFNRIYYGPPGTGKTYKVFDLLKEYKGSDNYSFVTFHQSYGYEEFVEGLRPVLDDIAQSNTNAIKYEIRPGVFKALCKKAHNNPGQRFAMVIDEINRGNISKIFGELITLIEPDKREGEGNALSVTLPYSGGTFSVPRNVDIIGTMNTADRSLALLDTALRRRFEFVPVLPDTRDETDAPLFGLRVKKADKKEINIPLMLSVINQRIEALYDRDHCIGHAYFTSLKDLGEAKRFEELSQIFRNRILPLLEEYFFEDWQKIRLVLGDNQKKEGAQFVKESKDHEKDLSSLFGSGDHGLDSYTTKQRYEICEKSFDNPDAYIGIYEKEKSEQPEQPAQSAPSVEPKSDE